MDARDLRSFVERPWDVLEASKRAHWGREFRERGPSATVEAAHVLWLHMRALDPDWPSREQRETDLAHHIALKRDLARAASALARLPAL
jgi:hypothetical protein